MGRFDVVWLTELEMLLLVGREVGWVDKLDVVRFTEFEMPLTVE